jgi:type IX secretion system PorP/SprF family membrane protein
MIKFSIKIGIAFAIIFSSIAMYGQQEAQYTQFMYNKMLVNPGFSGARRAPSVSALYRNQWMDYNGHPLSYLASFDAPLGKSRLGAGMVLQRQSEGIMTRSMANLALSYAIIQTEETTLRFGLSGTARSFRFSLEDPEVYIKDSKDPLVNPDNPNTINANIGAGVYFDNRNYYFGVSVPNLMKKPISLKNNLGATYLGTEKQHVYVMAGGFFDLFGNPDLSLKPSVMYKYVPNAPFSMDANLSVMFNRTFMIGGSYRFGGKYGLGDLRTGGGDSADLLAFVQATDQLGVGLAYDFTLSQLASHAKGSFELVTRYDFVPTKTRILHNPRIFF